VRKESFMLRGTVPEVSVVDANGGHHAPLCA
jgi:hypothetical protein